MIYSSGTTGQPKGVRFEITGQPLGTVSRLFKSASIFIRWMPLVDIYRPRRSITQRRYATTCCVAPRRY